MPQTAFPRRGSRTLSISDFARFLGLYEDQQIVAIRSRLTAHLTRGIYEERTVPPAFQRFHSQFVDFTMNRTTEAGNPLIPYLINPRMAHQPIAER